MSGLALLLLLIHRVTFMHARWMCLCTRENTQTWQRGLPFFSSSFSAKSQQWRTVGIAPGTMGAIVPVFHRRQLFALNNVCSSSLRADSFPSLDCYLNVLRKTFTRFSLRAFDERGDNWFIYLTYRMHHQLLVKGQLWCPRKSHPIQSHITSRQHLTPFLETPCNVVCRH